MLRLFLWTNARHWRRHPVLAAVNLISVALGVAVFLSIQLINRSAVASFEATIDAVAGRANRQVRAVGAPFPETLYPSLRFLDGVQAATPIVEAVLPLARVPGEFLRITGVDPFSGRAFQTFEIDGPDSGPNSDRFFNHPGAVSLTAEYAAELGVEVGDTVETVVHDRRATLEVVALLRFKEPVPGMDKRIAVMDIANAQELLDRQGTLDRIDLIVKPGFRLPDSIALPPNADWGRPAQRSAQVENMLGAFQLNLTALSMIALFVGTFLIYNTVSTEVVRRRREIGILRALGVTPARIQILFLAHALWIAVAGVLLGLVGGVVLAALSLDSVSRTISSLYLLVRIEKVFLPAEYVLGAAALGCLAVLVGAWKPAREAARMAPVDAIHLPAPGEYRPRRRYFLAGIALLLLSLAQCAAVWNGVFRWMAFSAALCFLLGMSLCVPVMTLLLNRLAAPILRRAFAGIGTVASTHFTGSLNRTAVTIAALSCALAMMMGVATMIHSFRITVQHWIGASIQADIYVSPEAQLYLGAQSFLPDRMLSDAMAHPAIEAVDTFRERIVEIDGESLRLGASDLTTARARSDTEFLDRDASSAWAEVTPKGDGSSVPSVIISESLSRRLRLASGDELPVPTPSGIVPFRIAGVFRDYTSDRGMALMDRHWMRRFWNDTRFHGIAFYLRSPEDLDPVLDWVRNSYSPNGELRVYSNRTLREQILKIFDQTFAITYLLRLVAVVVAVLGIFLTMTVLVTERQREIAMLRSIGATPAQIRRMVLLEAGSIGFFGYCAGLLTGIGLAWILTFIINQAWFGWTIEWHWPAFLFLEAPLLALGAALIAGWWPAARASVMPVSESVRDE